MRVDELSKKDWVEYDGDKYQISSMWNSACTLCKYDGVPLIGKHYEDLKPIELTEDILLLNGWGDEGDEEYNIYLGALRLSLLYTPSAPMEWFVFAQRDDQCDTTLLTTIHYVHELQHVLWALSGEKKNIRVC